MDEALLRIHHACHLAGELESTLPNIANQPHLLLSSAEEVARAFDRAIHVVRSEFINTGLGGGAMDPHSRGRLDEGNPFFFHGLSDNEIGSMKLGTEVGVSSGMALMEFSTYPEAIAIFGEGYQAGAATEGFSGGSRPAGSSAQRRRKRYDSSKFLARNGGGGECITRTRVAAPRTRNSKTAPHDGYAWRKYGQKNILRSKFPRSYYHCAHKNYFGCEAKKQIQRIDDDPYTFEVTYRGKHTCHTSPPDLIAASLLPASNNLKGDFATGEATQYPSSSTNTIQMTSWLQMELEGAAEELHNTESGDGDASSFLAQREREVHYPVTDMADVLFNSSNNMSDMDVIFSLKEGHCKDHDA